MAGVETTPNPQEGEGCRRYGSPSRAGRPAQADADGGSRRSPWISATPTSPGRSGCSAKRGGRLAPGPADHGPADHGPADHAPLTTAPLTTAPPTTAPLTTAPPTTALLTSRRDVVDSHVRGRLTTITG